MSYGPACKCLLWSMPITTTSFLGASFGSCALQATTMHKDSTANKLFVSIRFRNCVGRFGFNRSSWPLPIRQFCSVIQAMFFTFKLKKIDDVVRPQHR